MAWIHGLEEHSMLFGIRPVIKQTAHFHYMYFPNISNLVKSQHWAAMLTSASELQQENSHENLGK